MARVFSLKHSSTPMGNMGIYSVGIESVYQKWQFGKIEYLVGVSREGLTREILAKTSCLHPVLTLRILVMCKTHASLRKDAYSRATCENTLVFNALSLHTLSLSLSLSHTHTTLTNKSHMKLRVQKIEHNYNQIWHRIKANKTHSCKLQL